MQSSILSFTCSLSGMVCKYFEQGEVFLKEVKIRAAASSVILG